MKKTDPFKYFKERVEHWVDHFGLYSWDVNVHQDTDEYDGNLAYTMFNVGNKRADIYLVMDWVKMDRYGLNKTAFHEVVEVMLAEVRDIAGRRDIRFEEIDGAIHSIIRILTATIFEKEKK